LRCNSEHGLSPLAGDYDALMPSEFRTKQSQKSQQAKLQKLTTPCRGRFHGACSRASM